MSEYIHVQSYDPQWAIAFEQEKFYLETALGDNCLVVHHVGSTAIPDLKAKPKIDIIAVVKEGRSTLQPLAQIGYTYKGEWNVPCKYGFTKRDTTEFPVNLHLFEEGHPEIELNLMFRDFLRTHPADREAYTNLKERILAEESAHERTSYGFPKYTLRKREFIDSILKKAGYDKRRILKCATEAEWQAAKDLRQQGIFGPNRVEDIYQWTFDHPHHAHLVLYQGVEIIGYAHLQLWAHQRAAMRIIVIEEGRQQKGLGSDFLRLCEKWLKHQGYTTLHVESHPRVIHFYRRNGYTDMTFNDPDGHESDPHDISVGKSLF